MQIWTEWESLNINCNVTECGKVRWREWTIYAWHCTLIFSDWFKKPNAYRNKLILYITMLHHIWRWDLMNRYDLIVHPILIRWKTCAVIWSGTLHWWQFISQRRTLGNYPGHCAICFIWSNITAHKMNR